MKDDTMTLHEVEVKAVSAKALLVEYEGEEHWIPVSQIDLPLTNVKFVKGAKGRLEITEWIAKEKGIT